jgi:unsaturated rhamnogalacturonyl hydrolase
LPRVTKTLDGLIAPFCLALVSCAGNAGALPNAPPPAAVVGGAQNRAAPVAPLTPAYVPKSPSKTVEIVSVAVTNDTGEDQLSETVTVNSNDIRRFWAEPSQLVLTNSLGQRLLSQLVDTDGDESPDELVFQVDLPAGQTKNFQLGFGTRTEPTREKFKVYGRFVRERHDDFAWENDRIAHRVYGPDLETYGREPLTSSGVDVWVKRTRNLVINDWYMVNDYHRDHGDGADFYSVGKSRGCGGLGIWFNDKLYVSRNFASSRVLANGPLRLLFELHYAPFDAGALKVSETKRVTLDAGQNFGKYSSTFTVSGTQPALAVAVGIAKHTGSEVRVSPDATWMHTWEPISESDGALGCGVVLPPGTRGLARETESDYLLVADKAEGKPLVYYAGFGWDRSGDFANKAAFTAKMAAVSRAIAKPMTISLTAGGEAAPWSTRACNTMLATQAAALTREWTYDGGFVLLGCQRAGRKHSNPQFGDFVKQAVDRLIGPDGSIKGYRLDEYNIDNLNMGKVLFALRDEARTPAEKQKYEAALRLLRSQMKTHPRTKEGGFWHKQIYPNQLWLDGAYMAGPFLAHYAVIFNEPPLLDEVAQEFILLERHTRDPKTGLLFHGWDESRSQRWANPKTGTSPNFWGRAVGWYAMALVDTLEILPVAHPKRAALIAVLNRLSTAVAATQEAETGVWWQILDQAKREKNYREASATAMFVYALSKGVRLGWLDAKKYATVAERGYRGILERFVDVNSEGLLTLRNVCKVAGLGGTPYRDGSYEYYTGTEVVTNDPKGVGAFIMASLERE